MIRGLSWLNIAAALALGLLLFAALGAPLTAALYADSPAGGLHRADLRALTFTLTQAGLSAAISVVCAIPLSRALARRRFHGRGVVLAILGAPFLLPVATACLGILAVWGRSGWVNTEFGLGVDIYGLAGVLTAHAFFNIPLATRMIMQAYQGVPPEQWRGAAQLGLSGWSLFRAVEAPALRAAAPGAFALVFLICAASFAAVLLLGGGPRATTLEVAIYEAAAYEYDLGRAALLAALQALVCAGAALAALAASGRHAAQGGALTQMQRWDGQNCSARCIDAAVFAAAAAFLIPPMAAALTRGLEGLSALTPSMWEAVVNAAGRSIVTALAACAIALMLALPLAAWFAQGKGRGLEALALSSAAASPFVLAIALIILTRSVLRPADAALGLTALVNAVAAAPFALRILTPAMGQAHRDYGPLADGLGLAGWTRFRAVYAAPLAAPLGVAAGVAAALSAGDLGVAALFSDPRAPTLPVLTHQFAGARRLEAAFGAALVLTALALTLFVLFDWAGRIASARLQRER